MALPITLGTLVSRGKRRANRDGDDQLDTSEWKELFSEKYGELHALVSEKGARYFETEATVNLSDLTLPADHLSTLSVDVVLSGSTGARRPIYGPITVQDRSYLVGLTSGSTASCFAIEAGKLAFYPSVSSGTYKHLYLPQPTDYSTASDATAVDVINIYGQKFLIWGVAAIAAHRGSDDQTRALAEEKKAQDQLEYWACNVSMTHAFRRPISPPWADNPLGWQFPGWLR